MKRRMSMVAMAVMVLVSLLVITTQSHAAVANGVNYDSSDDYDATDNTQPDGQWSYGKYNGTADWGSFIALAETNFYTSGVGGDETLWTDTSGSYPKVGEFFIHPDATEMAVKRWTSDITGTIEIDYDIFSLKSSTKNFYIIKNGTKLILEGGDVIILADSDHHAETITTTVTAGDVIDFCIHDNNGTTSDWTHLWARIRATHLRPTALPTGLVMHWDLDGPNDLPTGYNNRYDKILDVSGNNRHGVLNYVDNDERVDGQMGNAIDLNGSDNLMSVDLSVLNGATELTIALWIKPDSRNNWDGLVTSAAGSMTGLVLADYANGIQPYARIMNNDVGNSSTIPAPNGVWSHVVLVWSSNAYTRIYVNGRLGCDDASPYNGAISGSTTWYMGRDRTESNRNYDGKMDDLTIWTNALTEAQIGEIYNLGIHGWDASYLNNEPTGSDISFLPYTTGLKVWLDGSDVDGQSNSTLSDGDDITTWVNKAGGTAGNAVTGNSSAKGGVFSVGTGNKGGDTVVLNGSGDSFKLSEFMSTDTFTMFFVAKNTGGTGDRVLYNDYGSVGAKLIQLRSDEGHLYLRDGANHVFTETKVGTQMCNNSWKRVIATLSESGGNYTVEVGEIGSTVSNTDAAYVSTTWEGTANTQPHIGQFDSGTTHASHFGGEIAEILIYDHAVTGADRTAIENHLYNKYWTLGTMVIIN